MVLQRCLPGVHRLCSALTGSLAIFEPARSVLSPSPPPNPLSPHLPSASSAGLKDSRAESICLLNTGTVHTFLIGSTIMPWHLRVHRSVLRFEEKERERKRGEEDPALCFRCLFSFVCLTVWEWNGWGRCLVLGFGFEISKKKFLPDISMMLIF